jgi:hypothetical protein
MARHPHRTLPRVVHRLRPSPVSVAGAAAVYEPSFLPQLQARQ